MNQRCFVLATLGTSPAVLTELLYHLAVNERADIVGLEVWTTTKGQDDLAQHLSSGAWTRLLDDVTGATGAGRLPTRQTMLDTGEIVGEVTRGRRPLVVRSFRGEDGPLADVRTPADARSMDARLFERVQALTRDLPADVVLIGSLAGGRKTMSAGLQGAFSLLGRPQDRLVHVLLDPRLEALGFKELRDYNAPTAEWAARSGVPIEAQVTLHDVHFPLLRGLLERARVDGREPLAGLIGKDYASFLRAMRDAATSGPEDRRAHLGRHAHRADFVYSIRAANVTAEVELPRALGQVLAGLIDLGRPATLDELAAWLAEHTDAFERTNDDDHAKDDANRVSQYLRRLGKRLAGLSTQGLTEFMVAHPRRGVAVVPAAEAGRVTLDRSDLE